MFLEGHDIDKRLWLLCEAMMGEIRASVKYYSSLIHATNTCGGLTMCQASC